MLLPACANWSPSDTLEGPSDKTQLLCSLFLMNGWHLASPGGAGSHPGLPCKILMTSQPQGIPKSVPQKL